LHSAASNQAIVLTARGSQLEKEFAFGAVRQLFEPLLADDASADAILAPLRAQSPELDTFTSAGYDFETWLRLRAIRST